MLLIQEKKKYNPEKQNKNKNQKKKILKQTEPGEWREAGGTENVQTSLKPGSVLRGRRWMARRGGPGPP